MSSIADLFVTLSGDTSNLTTSFASAAASAKASLSQIQSAASTMGESLHGSSMHAGSGLQSLSGYIHEAQHSFEGMKEHAEHVMSIAEGVGVAFAAEKIIEFAIDGVKSLGDVEKASAQTAAAIHSTGGAAGVTLDHVRGLSESLEKLTGVDESVIQGGQNLILTFTNIRNVAGAGNDIFDQTTKTVLDMSKALGEDMKSASIQVGKALQDPIHGMTALHRVGVAFSAAQKEQIKTMQEHGDLMGAQKIILGELHKEFGGVAEAVGNTLPGAFDKLHASFELVGKSMAESTGFTEQLTAVLLTLNAGFNSFAEDIKAHGLGQAMRDLFPPEMQAIIIGIGGAITVAMMPAIGGVATALVGAVVAAAPFIAAGAAIAAGAYIIMNNWGPISGFFTATFEAMRGAAVGFYDRFHGVLDALVGAAEAAVQGILAPFKAIIDVLPKQFKDAIGNTLGAIPGMASKVAGDIGAAGSKIAGTFGEMGKKVEEAHAKFKKWGSEVPEAVAPVADGVGKVKKKVDEAAKHADSLAKAYKDAMADLPGALKAIETEHDILGNKVQGVQQEISKIEEVIRKAILAHREHSAAVQEQIGHLATLHATLDQLKTQDALKALADTMAQNTHEAHIWGETMSELYSHQMEAVKSKINELSKNYDENKDTIDGLIDKYNDYKDKLDGLKTPLEKTTASMTDWSQSINKTTQPVANLTNGISQMLGPLGGALPAGFTNAMQGALNFAGGVSSVIGSVSQLLPQVVAGIASLASYATTQGIATIASGALSVASYALGTAITFATGPIGIAIAAVAALVVAVEKIIEYFNKASDAGQKVVQTTMIMASTTDDTADSVKQFREVWGKYGDQLDAIRDKHAVLGASYDDTSDRIQAMQTTLLDLNRIGQTNTDTYRDLKASYDALKRSAEETTEATKRLAEEQKQLQAISSSITSGIDSALKSSIKKFLDGGSIADLQTGLRDGVKQAIIDGVIQATVQGAVMKGAIGGLLDQLTTGLSKGEDVSGIISQIGDAIPKVTETLGKTLAPLKDALSSAFGAPASAAPAAAPASATSNIVPFAKPATQAPTGPVGLTLGTSQGAQVGITINYTGSGSQQDVQAFGQQLVQYLRQQGIGA